MTIGLPTVGIDREHKLPQPASRPTFATRLMAWGTLSALPAPAAAGVIVALIGVSWLVTIPLGGAGLVAPHWFYIPVFMAGLRFGPWGALATAATSMIVAGPLLPLSFNPTTAQATSDWVSRGIFFIVIGQLVTLLFSAVRGLTALEAHLIEEQAVREAQAEAVRESEQRFRALVQRSTDMILVVDPDGTVVSESPAVERILGWMPGQRLARPTIDFVHPDDQKRASSALNDVLTHPGKSCTVELRQHDATGLWHWVESTITNMIDEPTVRGIVVNDRVVDERKALENELLHRALHDSLTGLANRALLRERLESALMRRDLADRPPGLLFIDVDDFKLVNDSCGHEAGDRLLKEIASRLRACARPEDLVARIGGDEFAVLIEERPASGSAATDVAQRILNSLQHPFDVSGRLNVIGASIGIASYHGGTPDADQILRQADIAMYNAKADGKSRFVIFSDEMDEFFRGSLSVAPNLWATLVPEEILMTDQEHVLARLLEELPEAVVVLGVEGQVLWANALAERLFGRSLEGSIGQSGLDLVHPDDLELVLRSFATVQTKPIGTFIEVRVKTPTGWRLVEVVGNPVTWFERDGVLFALRDLTERRRFEVAHDDDARFRSLQQNAANITMLVSPDGRISSVSAALTRILGHDPELVEHQALADLVVEQDRPAPLRVAINQALQSATAANPVTVEVHLHRYESPERVPFEMTIVNLVDDPTVEGLVITAHDISARVSAEVELRDTLSQLQATLDSTADGILVVDVDGQITNFNARFAEMWRVPEDVMAERVDHLALTFVVDQLLDPHSFIAKVRELYGQPEAVSNDTIVFKDGRVFERYSQPQLVDGGVVGRVWSFSDVTERKQLEEELSYQALHDSLTGLANKALFRDHVNLALARTERNRTRVAVLFLDVDDFKLVNDSLGHSVGDELLSAVAQLLVGCLRHADTAARLGGDEFAVLMEDFDGRDEAIKLAQRILEVLRRPIIIGTHELSITVSIGITFGEAGNTSEELLSNVDLAMYRAKKQGKNRHEEFQVQMHAAVVERHQLQVDLRRALVAGELAVHYQPIVEIHTDRIVGFEALVRWQHPSRGQLEPASFIPLAEEIGLIDVIDRFVLTEACARARRWQDGGLAPPDLAISVNLSAYELMDAGIGKMVSEALRTSGFQPSNLILEITESAMMKDIESAVQNLHTLKALGLRIALDDFGTGYSSLAHLERLPIDILKIDRSFVATLGCRDEAVNLAYAIIQLAETLGYTTIAEGVESAAQGAHLGQLGCSLAQGYHLGMPLDADSTEQLLRLRSTDWASQGLVTLPGS